jgi:hypothetical protein
MSDPQPRRLKKLPERAQPWQPDRLGASSDDEDEKDASPALPAASTGANRQEEHERQTTEQRSDASNEVRDGRKGG